jgi:hypothetical protein
MKIPTEEEVINYANFQYNGLHNDLAEDFYLHYEKNGWRLGNNNPMANWQAALKLWVRDNEKKNKDGKQQYKQDRGKGFNVIR